MAETERHEPAQSGANSSIDDSAGWRPWVIAGCVGAMLIFVGAVAVLYLEWVHVEAPTSMIIVSADAARDTATVTVTPLRGTIKNALQAQIKNGVNHRLRFHVPPGWYSVAVRGENNELIWPEQREATEFDLAPHTQAYIALPKASQSRSE
jgi:hypothetical protein